eukprot:m.75160 g.75160  ORF g.75160 m.75160 type:complete len:702 (-) comp12434_c0_seq6:1305-3410(-)
MLLTRSQRLLCVFVLLLFAMCCVCDMKDRDSSNTDGDTVPETNHDRVCHTQRQPQQEVRDLFEHAYKSYLDHAFPHDELQPLTCQGRDTWGPLALTFVDAIDMHYLLGDCQEFYRAIVVTLDVLDLAQDRNVSVFEVNIRILGGLLSAYHLASSPSSLCPDLNTETKGQLLQLSEKVATLLLPAFDTPTGLPYGTVNLLHGVPPSETTVTSLAGAGTHLLEFISLSRWTGNTTFENVAKTAARSLWARRSKHDLVGNHIDIKTSVWTFSASGIGPNQDSYYEYLLKAFIMTGDDEYLLMFQQLYHAINKHLKHQNWYIDVDMQTAKPFQAYFSALSAFWPGLQVLYGDTSAALRTMHKFMGIWHRFGYVPESYDLLTREIPENQHGYFLRPEMAESLYYLYKATKDVKWRQYGLEILDSLLKLVVPCGVHVLRNVETKEPGDWMESFFLSETLKYLFLLFDDQDPLSHLGHGVFSTEAHFLPVFGYTSSLKATKYDPPKAFSWLQHKTCSKPHKFPHPYTSYDLRLPASEPVVDSKLTLWNKMLQKYSDSTYEHGPHYIVARSMRFHALRSSCVQAKMAGYWTYEVCFGAHVSQFHVENTTTTHRHLIGIRSTLEELRNSTSLQLIMDTVYGSRGSHFNGWHFTQEFTRGDRCDIDGQQVSRSATVHYRCPADSKTPAMTVKEPRQCTYLIDILLPQLCFT